MGEWEINLKKTLIFSIKKTIDFSIFNYWFMMANQKFIIMRIDFY
jgi:hypothetical protein